MRRVRSFTGIWQVQKILYAVGDWKLPLPVPFTWVAWFVITLFAMLIFGGFLSGLWRYGVIPVGVATLMSRATFDGKRPDRFLVSAALHLIRPRLTFADRPVKERKEKTDIQVTAVRRMIV